MTKITLKNKEFSLNYDEAALFRFSKEGGKFEAFEDKKNPFGSLAHCVILVWCALDEEALSIYPTPDSFAKMILNPLPESSVIEQIRIAAEDGWKDFK